MAESERLGVIASAGTLLDGVDGRQRGEPIEAAQWNTLVEVLRTVLGIDRDQELGVAERLAGSFARLDHEHLGRVSFAWLDADLQERLTAGTTGAVTVRAALAAAQGQVQAAVAQLATLSDRLEQAQRRIDDGAVDELARAAKLRGFEDRFTGLETMRGTVEGLTSDVAALGPRVGEVIAFRETLLDDAGVPIDVRAVAAALAALGDRLDAAVRGVDGQPLRLVDIWLALRDVEAVVGLGGGASLEERLQAEAAQVEGRLETSLDTRALSIADTLRASLDDELARMRGRFEEELQRLAPELTDRVLGEVSNRVTDVVLDRIRGEIDERADERVQRRLEPLLRRQEEHEERLRRLEQRVF